MIQQADMAAATPTVAPTPMPIYSALSKARDLFEDAATEGPVVSVIVLKSWETVATVDEGVVGGLEAKPFSEVSTDGIEVVEIGLDTGCILRAPAGIDVNAAVVAKGGVAEGATIEEGPGLDVVLLSEIGNSTDVVLTAPGVFDNAQLAGGGPQSDVRVYEAT